MAAVDVFLEVGKKRVFAAASDWPGWSRSSRDEAAAMQALIDYGPRYKSAIGKAVAGFKTPARVADLNLVERLKGDASTDYGVQHRPPSSDSLPIEQPELHRLVKLLKACWQAFDTAAEAGASTTLRTGPRGGGRDVQGIHAHVLDADAAYLHQLGGTFDTGGGGAAADLELVHAAFLKAIAARL